MKKLKRHEIIEKLINDDMDNTSSEQTMEYIYNILKSGFKGYDNYTKKELLEEYVIRFV